MVGLYTRHYELIISSEPTSFPEKIYIIRKIYIMYINLLLHKTGLYSSLCQTSHVRDRCIATENVPGLRKIVRNAVLDNDVRLSQQARCTYLFRS